MKYILLLCDGMADRNFAELGGKTPMAVSKTPCMDFLAKRSKMGLVKTVADDLKPGSDVANLSVLGYDPHVFYSGRSPLEAMSVGVEMSEKDVSYRCNLVTLSDEENYADKTIIDYCAGDISTNEAEILVEFLAENLNDDEFSFFSGVSYRHILLQKNAEVDKMSFTPPHDITGKPIKNYLPQGENTTKLYEFMVKSHELLKNHPVNIERVKKGERPANSVWFWGEGTKKPLSSFEKKFGLKGAMISAVDLLKGIGILAEMQVIDVPNATGYIDTNFEGKAQAALKALEEGCDFAYIHVEAPDECGHRGEAENKVKSLEYIDQRVLKIILDGLEKYDDYKIMVVPDHATPLEVKTHTNEPVPFMIYHKKGEVAGQEFFTEETAKTTGIYIEKGDKLIEEFING